jgi:hypothetical protein
MATVLCAGMATGLCADLATVLYTGMATGMSTGMATGVCAGMATGLCAGVATRLCAGMATRLCAGIATVLCVGMATELCAGIAHGPIPDRGRKYFASAKVQTAFGAHPAPCPVGARGSFPGVKLLRRAVDHSPSPSAEVKNEWSCTSAASYLDGLPRDNLHFKSLMPDENAGTAQL